MLLNRIKTEPSPLSSTLSVPKPSTSTNAYEDAKRRVMAGMSMSMPAPVVPAVLPTLGKTTPAAPKTMSAIRKVTAGLTGRGKIKIPATDSKPLPNGLATRKPGRPPGSARTGLKRKRGKGQDGEDASSLSSSSDDEDGDGDDQKAPAMATPTTTKSGRQVTKPIAYNPAEMDSISKKRVYYGKRKPGEAMCKRCSRLASVDADQIVFCDGCEGAWHQLCHDPEIDDSVVQDPNVKWFCAGCMAKRERVSKKIKIEAPSSNARASWVVRTPGQVSILVTAA